ncbi:MAG: acetolactate synthase [Paracoccaceae bacterium]|nr:acetolactate synthase [Paracoccaceae bacterium]
MRGVGLATMIGVCAGAAWAGPKVPSGQAVSLMEVVWPEARAQVKTARFRFLAPAIVTHGKGVGPDEAEDDMAALCEGVALPTIVKSGKAVQEIVVSLSQKPVKLGETRDDVVQFFEAYVVKGGHCTVEGIGE